MDCFDCGHCAVSIIHIHIHQTTLLTGVILSHFLILFGYHVYVILVLQLTLSDKSGAQIALK